MEVVVRAHQYIWDLISGIAIGGQGACAHRWSSAQSQEMCVRSYTVAVLGIVHSENYTLRNDAYQHLGSYNKQRRLWCAWEHECLNFSYLPQFSEHMLLSQPLSPMFCCLDQWLHLWTLVLAGSNCTNHSN